MQLTSSRYLAPDAAPVVQEHLLESTAGWTAVARGLISILAGYVLSIVNGVALVGLLLYVSHGFTKSVAKVTGDDLTVLLIGAAILFFSSLYSSYLVLRGKWRCMTNAPERNAARWFMFASLVCFFAGPTLNFVSGLTGAELLPPGADRAKWEVEAGQRRFLADAAVKYTQRYRDHNATAYLQLAGGAITPLCPIFFVLFLRSVHGCMGSFLGARFTELYLLFVVLLFAGSFTLVLDSRNKLRPDLILLIGGAWLIAGLWYFLLIAGAVVGILGSASRPRSASAF